MYVCMYVADRFCESENNLPIVCYYGKEYTESSQKKKQIPDQIR